MTKIKKLSALPVKELSSEMQKTILGGVDPGHSFCLEQFGPCPPGMRYIYDGRQCYCAEGDPDTGGGGSGGSGGWREECGGFDLCMPADGCSSWIGVSTVAATNLW